MDDIMGFRNNAYRSLMTGTMSPASHAVEGGHGRLHGRLSADQVVNAA